MSSPVAPAALAAWAPLRHTRFRALWLAGLVSAIGTWMHNVGSAVLMTELTSSPVQTAMLQTVSSLGVLLLVFPAGALGDILDRRRLLMFAQGWMLIMAGVMAWVTWHGDMKPWLLLWLTFGLGLGAALNTPAWQALFPALVPREEVAHAVTLNGASFNLARVLGPAIGGIVVAAAGPAAVFALNALTFIATIATLARWPTLIDTPRSTSTGLFDSMRGGLAHARTSRPLQHVLARGGAFVVGSSALWALVPVLGRLDLGLDAQTYGALFGSLGAGAVLGWVFLPYWRARVGTDTLVTGAGLAFGVAMLALTTTNDVFALSAALLAAGGAWITGMTTFNTAAQLLVPRPLVTRAVALYIFTFQVIFTLSTYAWGVIAARFGTHTALGAAAAAQLLSLAAPLVWPLPATLTTAVEGKAA